MVEDLETALNVGTEFGTSNTKFCLSILSTPFK